MSRQPLEVDERRIRRRERPFRVYRVLFPDIYKDKFGFLFFPVLPPLSPPIARAVNTVVIDRALIMAEAHLVEGLTDDQIISLFQNARKSDYEKVFQDANLLLADWSSKESDPQSPAARGPA